MALGGAVSAALRRRRQITSDPQGPAALQRARASHLRWRREHTPRTDPACELSQPATPRAARARSRSGRRHGRSLLAVLVFRGQSGLADLHDPGRGPRRWTVPTRHRGGDPTACSAARAEHASTEVTGGSERSASTQARLGLGRHITQLTTVREGVGIRGTPRFDLLGLLREADDMLAPDGLQLDRPRNQTRACVCHRLPLPWVACRVHYADRSSWQVASYEVRRQFPAR